MINDNAVCYVLIYIKSSIVWDCTVRKSQKAHFLLTELSNVSHHMVNILQSLCGRSNVLCPQILFSGSGLDLKFEMKDGAVVGRRKR